MKITVESTSTIVESRRFVHDQARVWEGTTESGIPVTVFIASIAVKREEDNAQFERELVEQRPRSSFPFRMFLP